MTIGEKLHQTLASLEGAAANLKTFALDTQDKMAQQMFNDLSGQVENICNNLRGRVNYIEGQEPQYKVKR
ncbi:hypothetical protein Tfer_3168 [Thermincola ferriacetica]|uniref:DUF1657 domain-containing protein n=1 Tax=Thermincola ferriacetica TaxID=281456 RepID=A0A0L6VYK5_9FIRM|nr:DUF1657 domain-containing protein [Thermincola ferriacetica]KNZ68301.1 hypothetical protein Tfer_3168 [Thermincola ferriacetica]